MDDFQADLRRQDIIYWSRISRTTETRLSEHNRQTDNKERVCLQLVGNLQNSECTCSIKEITYFYRHSE